eukprot:gene14246-15731_t
MSSTSARSRNFRTFNDVNANKVELKPVGDKKGAGGDKKTTEAKKDAKDGAEAVVDLKSEAAKRRQRTSQSIEQRMLERKQQKASEDKKRMQGRAAFKQQLEANAPKRSGPKQSSIKRNPDSNIEKLLKWAQIRTREYPGVEITDFSSSWADGLAFCALLNSYFPGEFPLKEMHETDRKINLDIAFKFAGEKGVPGLLETEDLMRSKHPEPRSIITYVHTIYKVLVQDKAEKEKEQKDKESNK